MPAHSRPPPAASLESRSTMNVRVTNDGTGDGDRGCVRLERTITERKALLAVRVFKQNPRNSTLAIRNWRDWPSVRLEMRPSHQVNLAHLGFAFSDLGARWFQTPSWRASDSAFPGAWSVIDSILEGGTPPLSQPLNNAKNPKKLKPSADRLVVTRVMFIHGSCGIWGDQTQDIPIFALDCDLGRGGVTETARDVCMLFGSRGNLVPHR